MLLKDFYYELPDDLIARFPTPERTASRLLKLCGETGEVSHHQFSDITHFLQPGDLLVFNNTKVIPARLFGSKSTGGKVEILIERILDNHRAIAHIKASKPPKVGSKLILEQAIEVVIKQRSEGLVELLFLHEKPILTLLEQYGHVPLPPYFNRDDQQLDRERYQTVYSQHPGAVAAPTAGLHFDQALLERLRQQDIAMGFVTLHVGAGTFQPVRTEHIEDHIMHHEYLVVSENVCEQIAAARARGKRVIAVGTTTVRSLETAARQGVIKPFSGETNIFIYPGYAFQCVDAMITNFHLPESTLLMLLCAFAGYDQVMQAYHTAVLNRYRFLSYGDAMFVTRR